MKQEDAPRRVHDIGTNVQGRWEELASGAGLSISTGGLPALANFSIQGLDPLAVKTFVTSIMLERGYLAGTNLYASIAHTPEILSDYYDALTPVFAELGTLNPETLSARLPLGTAQSGFQRLT